MLVWGGRGPFVTNWLFQSEEDIVGEILLESWATSEVISADNSSVSV